MWTAIKVKTLQGTRRHVDITKISGVSEALKREIRKNGSKVAFKGIMAKYFLKPVKEMYLQIEEV